MAWLARDEGKGSRTARTSNKQYNNDDDDDGNYASVGNGD